MIEIYDNLFIGKDEDAEQLLNEGTDGWAIVHACKEPWHRKLLGYTTKGAPKDHPEYYFAIRDNRMFMNLVDAPKSIFFDRDLIDEALFFIEESLENNFKVFVHCNEGKSRSASLGLLFLIKQRVLYNDTLEACEAEYLKIYPNYDPGDGIRGFVKENFDRYSYPF